MRVEGIDELEKALKEVGSKAVPIAKKAVNAAAPIVRDSLKSEVPKRTGDLAASIMIKPAEENLYGVFTIASPTGNDRRGNSNNMKLQVLEYGRKGGKAKSGRTITAQEPRPVRDRAVAKCQDQVVKTMEDVVYAEIERIMGE